MREEIAPANSRSFTHPRSPTVYDCSVRARQPDAQALCQRTFIQEMCQRNVLRDQSGCMNQNALVIAFAPDFLAGNQLMNFSMKLLAREQPGFDHPLELALQHVEFPGVD